MLDASFSVEGSALVQAHAVAYGATVDLAALSLSFRTIAWEIVSSSKSGTTTPTITLAGTPTGATASFPQVADPGDGLGRSWIVKCTQTDSQGNQAVAYRVVGTVNSQGYVPIAADEKNYRSLTHGWCEVINQMLATAGGGGVSAHSGLTGLTTGDDHTQYELAARTLVAYTGAASAAVLTDARKFITTSHGSANTFTIPPNASVAFATAALLGGVNIGAGSMTVTAGAGVTLNGSSFVVPQNGWWYSKKTNTDTWYVVVVSGAASASGGLGGDAQKLTFSALTTDADHGAGVLAFSSATPSAVTTLYVDDLDYAGTDITGWLASLASATGAIKGRITIQSISDPTKKLVYNLSAWTTGTGYKKLTVAHVFGTSLPTTAAGDTVLSFDSGPTVAGGPSVTVSAAGAIARAALTGDVTASADSNATTIANDAVTFAKIQNISAASRVLLRGSAGGAGDVEEGTVSGGLSISGTAITIADAALSWAKLAAAIGNLGFTGLKSITYNGEFDNGNSGTADTIDWSAGQVQKSTLTGNCTFTFSGLAVGFFQLKLIQDGTGSRTATWPTTTWISNGGAAPVLSTTAGAINFVTFYYDGTTLFGSAGAGVANDEVTFAKLQNIATNSLIGRDTASTGDPENILLDAATLEMDGSLNLRVPSQLGARGTENVVIDLYPSSQSQGTLTTANSVNFDVAIATGRRYHITASMWVDDGAGGAVLFTKTLLVLAHQTSGAAVKVAENASGENGGSGFTFSAAANSTNMRFTLSNTSGSTRSYNLMVGSVICDKP